MSALGHLPRLDQLSPLIPGAGRGPLFGCHRRALAGARRAVKNVADGTVTDDLKSASRPIDFFFRHFARERARNPTAPRLNRNRWGSDLVLPYQPGAPSAPSAEPPRAIGGAVAAGPAVSTSFPRYRRVGRHANLPRSSEGRGAFDDGRSGELEDSRYQLRTEERTIGICWLGVVRYFSGSGRAK